MGLFDGYSFEPDNYSGDSGGLLSRLLPEIQAGGYTPPQPPLSFDSAAPASPSSLAGIPAAPSVSQVPDYGQTQNIAIGNYQMPQFGNADVSQTTSPSSGLGDRLNAGFQSWVHTPAGNPIAGLANGIAGLSAGQPVDASGVVPSQTQIQPSAQGPDSADRLSAGFQSWAHTAVGNPIAALANGIQGFSSGQRADLAGNAQPDVNTQFQQLRPLLGDRDAMIAVVHPEAGRTLIAQALAKQQNSGDPDDPGAPSPAQPAPVSSASPAMNPSPIGATRKPKTKLPWSASYAR